MSLYLPWECPRCKKINGPTSLFCTCKPHSNTAAQDKSLIENMCLSYDHSFGVMTAEQQQDLRFQATEWLRAYRNNTKVEDEY